MVRARLHGPAVALLALLWLGGWLAMPVPAQVLPDTSAAEELEAYLDGLDEAASEPTQLVEMLEALAEHPLDINRATAAELAQVPALGPVLARAIVRQREASGPFGSVSDLQAIDGMAEAAYLGARPYLAVGAATRRNALRAEVVQRVTRRLTPARGYDGDTTRTTFVGSPERLYTRLSVRNRDRLSLNLTLEKDPGEAFTWDPSRHSYGYDHMTAHAAFGDYGRLQRVVVGDYTINAGQGVALWRSSAFGKGREPVRPIARVGRGLVPYASTEENRFFRGLATTVRLPAGLDMTLFASRRRLDAGIAAVDTVGLSVPPAAVTGLRDSGLHRTPAEQAAKDAVRESLWGAVLRYERGGARVGAAGYRSRFDPPFQRSEAPHARFAFSGTQASLVSVFGSASLGTVLLFGEGARDGSGVAGGIGGAVVRIGRVAEMAVLARHYPRDFVSLHGQAFGERSGVVRNETGYYFGLQLQPAPAWRFAGYYDQYRFPWMPLGVPRPGTGYDMLAVAEYRPRRWLVLYTQFRSETKEVGTVVKEAGRLLAATLPTTRRSVRLHGDYLFNPRLRLRARLEVVRHAGSEPADGYGFLLYQDVRWRPVRPLQLDLRLAVFDTDNYEARVFAHEQDLLYTFAVPAFSGRGQRTYVLGRWQPLAGITLQAKYAVTRFEDVEAVGTGPDAVDGNRLREVRVQLRCRF